MKCGVCHKCIYDMACNRNNNETMTFRKHVFKYKNMRKWMIDFSENLRIVALKWLELSRFISPKQSINSYLLIISYGVGVCCD